MVVCKKSGVNLPNYGNLCANDDQAEDRGHPYGGNTNWRNVSKATYVDSLYHPYKIVKLIGGMVYDCFSNIIGDRNPQYC